MPQRFLRPGITNSKLWNSVSFECQSLYIRIITLVDDFGRCDGRAAVVWGSCFAVWNEQNPECQITLNHVKSMLRLLHDNQLLTVYSADNKEVVQISQWQERVRDGAVSRFPQQSAATRSVPLLSPPSPSPSPSPSGTEAPVGGSAREGRKVFAKPDMPELELYASKIGLPITEALAFLDHYESNGWRVGRNPMRNWQATMRKWFHNWKNGTYANRNTRQKNNGRNAGTANEGRAGEYAGAAQTG